MSSRDSLDFLVRILSSRDAVVTVSDGRGGYGCTATVVGLHGERLRVRVTHANPGASVRIGDDLAIPAERVATWTCR